MSYADLADFMRAIGIEQHEDSSGLQRVLDAASEWIDSYCGRSFTLSEAETRLYWPIDVDLLATPDLVSITTLKTDTAGDRTFAETIASTDYILEPLNGPTYDHIRIWPTSGQAFVPGQLVQIVGDFGFATIPSSVQQACILLATRWFKRHEAPFGILGATDIGQFERISKEDPDVVSLLGPYQLTSTWVVV